MKSHVRLIRENTEVRLPCSGYFSNCNLTITVECVASNHLPILKDLKAFTVEYDHVMIWDWLFQICQTHGCIIELDTQSWNMIPFWLFVSLTFLNTHENKSFCTFDIIILYKVTNSLVIRWLVWPLQTSFACFKKSQ